MKPRNNERSPHDREWQLQVAKNRLSQVLDSALNDGPQTITLRGKSAVVVISFDEFKKMSQPKGTLSEFFKHSPLSGMGLDLSRSTNL